VEALGSAECYQGWNAELADEFFRLFHRHPWVFWTVKIEEHSVYHSLAPVPLFSVGEVVFEAVHAGEEVCSNVFKFFREVLSVSGIPVSDKTLLCSPADFSGKLEVEVVECFGEFIVGDVHAGHLTGVWVIKTASF
jgi:hypothetical protein